MQLIELNLKKLLITLLSCFALNTSAQVDESRDFVYLYSDSVIYAENVQLRPSFSDKLQLRADSKRIPLRQVKFFNNDEGFFANTSKLNAIGQVRLAVRTEEGRINLFEERSYHTFSDNHRHGYHNESRKVDTRMFYNKAYGDLKKVNYRNLRPDMADHSRSLELLEGYRKKINISKTLYVASAASIAVAFISFVAKSKNNRKISYTGGFNGEMPQMDSAHPNFTSGFVLLGVSAGFAIGGYSVNLAGLKKLEAAVDAYNR